MDSKPAERLREAMQRLPEPTPQEDEEFRDWHVAASVEQRLTEALSRIARLEAALAHLEGRVAVNQQHG